jgi:hypothetical protein
MARPRKTAGIVIAKFGPKGCAESGEFTSQLKEPRDVVAGKKGIECAVLHCQHFLLDLVAVRAMAKS